MGGVDSQANSFFGLFGQEAEGRVAEGGRQRARGEGRRGAAFEGHFGEHWVGAVEGDFVGEGEREEGMLFADAKEVAAEGLGRAVD